MGSLHVSTKIDDHRGQNVRRILQEGEVMRKTLTLMAALCTILGLMMVGRGSAGLQAGGKDKEGDKELKKFEGTWVMVSGEEKGKKLSEDVVKKAKLVIVGNKH